MDAISRRDVLPLLAASASVLSAQPASRRKTRNIIFIMTDGLRWQELFRGSDAALMNKEHGGVGDVDALRAAYWRDAAEDRRKALMPFLWSVVARQGQIFGNRDRGADASVTNGFNFSYPGYNETLCGFADPRIDSNDKKPNPNVTVLEWLNRKPAYRGKVAAFAAWDTFPYILNAERAGFPVNAGFDAFTAGRPTPTIALLNRLKNELPKTMGGEPYDAVTFHTALEYFRQVKPRVLYLSLGETDEWAHAGNYAQYLAAARRADDYVKELWDTAQSMPEYRDATTLIFSPDHGRGEAPDGWKSHGQKLPESKYIWMAFLGPDTRPRGERSQIDAVKQNQIAATLAAFLGENYNEAVPQAGAPIQDVLPQ
jgi:Sulfatase